MIRYVATFIPVIEVALNDNLSIVDYRINWEDSYVVSKDIITGETMKGIDHRDIGGNARNFINALSITMPGSDDEPF